jgi:hypothetical protein
MIPKNNQKGQDQIAQETIVLLYHQHTQVCKE